MSLYADLSPLQQDSSRGIHALDVLFSPAQHFFFLSPMHRNSRGVSRKFAIFTWRLEKLAARNEKLAINTPANLQIVPLTLANDRKLHRDTPSNRPIGSILWAILSFQEMCNGADGNENCFPTCMCIVN